MTAEKVKLTLIAEPKDFQILDFFILGDGIIAPQELQNIALPAELDHKRGVVINGKGPVWLFAHLVHLCHPTAWVATADPRLGAVIVENHVPAGPRVGDVISPEGIKPYLPTHPPLPKDKQSTGRSPSRVVALIGPPHSGKSVFMNALRVAIRKWNPKLFQREFFIVRACPDGEGDWFADIPANEATTFRYKGSFTDEFVNKVCAQLDALKKQKSLLLVDCGGKIDKKNQAILNHCTHAIIVSSDPHAFAEWRGAAAASEVKVIAEVESVQDEISKLVDTGPPQRVKLGRLERHSSVINIPDILLESLLPTSTV
jgi:CRISPR-associated protein Csx3